MYQVRDISIIGLVMVGSFYFGRIAYRYSQEPAPLLFEQSQADSQSHKALFDLNQIGEEELCLLSGIGPTLAQKIIQYRTLKKRFYSLQELKDIQGIGTKRYKALKQYFFVRP